MKQFVLFLSLLFITTSYADTETVNWYVDGDVYNTTTCQTGGDIVLQTPPAKRGYRFTGWVVASYDFSTLDYTVDATSFGFDAYNWWVVFPYGKISGISVCSITPGTPNVAGTPDETTTGDNAVYCWCKATGYTPSGSNIVYENTSPSVWGFLTSYSSVSACSQMSGCISDCGFHFRYDAGARQVLLGIN